MTMMEALFKDLQEKQLPPEFLMLRNPDTDAYVLDNECLMLPAKAVTLKGQPKDCAGIAYIQNDQNYLCVEYEEDESYGRVYVTACIGGENKILAERKTEIRLCQNLRLKVNKNCAEAWLKAISGNVFWKIWISAICVQNQLAVLRDVQWECIRIPEKSRAVDIRNFIGLF